MAITPTAETFERVSRELAACKAENRALLARQAASGEVLKTMRREGNGRGEG